MVHLNNPGPRKQFMRTCARIQQRERVSVGRASQIQPCQSRRVVAAGQYPSVRGSHNES